MRSRQSPKPPPNCRPKLNAFVLNEIHQGNLEHQFYIAKGGFDSLAPHHDREPALPHSSSRSSWQNSRRASISEIDTTAPCTSTPTGRSLASARENVSG